MANDWLKINVNGQGWGTTGSGPLGTTPVQISAGTCDETIARSATIVFKAGSLTKRLKVTQGIAASPTIQLTPSLMTIGKTQTSQVALTVSNVDELTGWYWVITPSGANGVEVKYNNQVKTSSFSGTVTTVAASNLTVTNKTATSGNFTLKAELFTSEGRLLSTNTKSFVLTGDQNPTPTITLYYAGGNEILFHSGSTESVMVVVGNVPSTASYEWTIRSSRPNEIGINPISGATNNVTVALTNNDRSSGESWIIADLRVIFIDGTEKNVGSNTISIRYLPPDYNYRIVVDTQPSRTLNYNNTTSINFHVEDVNGHALSENGLSWKLDCVENWMNAQITRLPSQGTFSTNNNYSASTQLTDTSILWGATSVTLSLSLLKDGVVIDYIEGETNINRYINNITVNPRPILTIVSPNPDQGENVSEIEFAWIGESKTIQFISNMSWTTRFDMNRGFTLESGGSSGPAGASNSDYFTLTIRGERNTSTTTAIQDMFRIDNSGGASRYAGLCINPKEQLYIKLLPVDEQEVNYLDAVAKTRALVIPVSANVSTFSVVYDSIAYGSQQPSWLGAIIENYEDPRPHVTNALVLSTLSDNDTGSERPQSGSVSITLQTVDDYGTPGDTNDDVVIESQPFKIKQSAKSTNIYTVYVDGVAVWTNDPQQGGIQSDTFQAPTGGWPTEQSGRVLTITRKEAGSQSATIVGATWACDGNGVLLPPSNSQGGAGDTWGQGDGDPFTAPKALLKVWVNNTTSTAETHVRIFEDGNMNVLMWQGLWWQAPEDVSNRCSFQLSWQTPGTKTELTGTVTIGSERISPAIPLHVYFYRTSTSQAYEHIEVSLMDVVNNELLAGDSYDVEERFEMDWGNENGYVSFAFDNVETERIPLSSSGSAHSPIS